MRITVIQPRGSKIRDFICPVCNSYNSVTFEHSRFKGKIQCIDCKSDLEWNIEDEQQTGVELSHTERSKNIIEVRNGD